MKVTPLRNDFGVMIKPQPMSERWRDLDQAHLQQLIKTKGVVLLRGFDFEIADYEAFTLRFAQKMIPNRETFAMANGGYRDREDVSGDSLTATVNLHKGPIGWHSEDCHLPTSPHLLFLYCESPPLRGGATLLTDGIEIFSQCDESIRDFLTRHAHLHTWTLPPASVARMLGVGLQNVEEAVCRLVESLPTGQKLEIEFTTEHIIARFTEPLARITRWSQHKAFCNRLLLYRVLRQAKLREGAASSVVDPTPSEDFEDVLRVIDSLAYLSAYHVHWQSRDLVVFDNTRIMHARAPILDEQRRILTRSCIANF